MCVNDTKSKVYFGARTAATLLLAEVVLVTGNAVFAFAQQQQQRTFSFPEAATSAVFLTVQRHDEGALEDIVGAGSPPVPSNAVWRFDSQAGTNEVLCRRIGENEAMAIGALPLLVLAEREHQRRSEASVPEYARVFIGAEGARNGLYWRKGDGAIPEDLAKAGIDDQGTAGNSAVPFNGYYFRILTAQGNHAPGGAKSYVSGGKMTGGFAFVAYPAAYRSSGVKTFIAGSDGTVYERDLGPETAKIARSMTAYDPGPGWHVAEQYQSECQ
jgi:hypothetical protein